MYTSWHLCVALAVVAATNLVIGKPYPNDIPVVDLGYSLNRANPSPTPQPTLSATSGTPAPIASRRLSTRRELTVASSQTELSSRYAPKHTLPGNSPLSTS
ncbi:hypothetical protein GGR54DRAFT_358154 [Hypoxylon sp. NC1633]|nr:hypothetical protein GGR54DRAFT_358154 [Hypoxylon sp. NC1633]